MVWYLWGALGLLVGLVTILVTVLVVPQSATANATANTNATAIATANATAIEKTLPVASVIPTVAQPWVAMTKVVIQPRPVHLFINFFESSSTERHAENLLCLERNVALASIDVIHCVVDDMSHFQPLQERWGDKVVWHEHSGRPLFKDFFALFLEDTINVLANTDIEFTPSLELVKSFPWTNRVMFAVTRADEEMLVNPTASQDAWMCLGRPVLQPNFANFYLGKAGCDNALAWQFQASGYTVLNPCQSLVLIHHHQSNVRTYTRNPADVVPPPYYYVPQSKLMVLLQDTQL